MSNDLQFTVQRAPAYGELTDLAPGMYWVRLPVPLTLNHDNCWLLDDGGIRKGFINTFEPESA